MYGLNQCGRCLSALALYPMGRFKNGNLRQTTVCHKRSRFRWKRGNEVIARGRDSLKHALLLEYNPESFRLGEKGLRPLSRESMEERRRQRSLLYKGFILV